MHSAAPHPYLVPFDGKFKIADASTEPPSGAPKKRKCREQLAECIETLSELQKILYAHDHHAVLLVFQAMDAAGKDGTIRAVMSGINPAGCQVFSFKQPSSTELDHDFLWRTSRCLPERGRFGIFNRSYYEEVLVVRVHPEYLAAQRLPKIKDPAELWEQRLRAIRDHERHLSENGTLVLKFWLNVSKDEQRERFLSRLDEPEKHWKFSASDVEERGYWGDYMQAYESALAGTSREWAPWYAIPADNKPFMRLTVARIIVDNLKRLDLHYPKVKADDKKRFEHYRQALINES